MKRRAFLALVAMLPAIFRPKQRSMFGLLDSSGVGQWDTRIRKRRAGMHPIDSKVLTVIEDFPQVFLADVCHILRRELPSKPAELVSGSLQELVRQGKIVYTSDRGFRPA